MSQYSSEADVLETVLNCLESIKSELLDADDEEFIYDDKNDRYISFEDARCVVEELKAAEELSV
jgi:hypothetical protein